MRRQPPRRVAGAAKNEVNEVTVTGMRRSLQSSQETKRDAVVVADAISAEDVER